MKTAISAAAFAASLLLASASSACQREESSYTSTPAAGSAILWGTVFDLKTGEPAADVEVRFESAKAVRTDAAGRFEFSGLALRSAGTARAIAADGREGTVQVLPLNHERREIVLNISAH